MRRAIRSAPGPLHPSPSPQTYSHPIEKVSTQWGVGAPLRRAISDPAIVSPRRNGEGAPLLSMPTTIVAQAGHRFTFATKPYPGFDGTVHCVVTVAEPPHELAYTWSGGGLRDTTVRFRLEALNAEETFLRFEHEGFDGLLNRLIARNVLAAGWRGKLLKRRLPEVLAQL